MAEEVLFTSLMGPSVSASLIFTGSCTRDACKLFSGQIRPQWRLKVAGRSVQLPSFVCKVNEKSTFGGGRGITRGRTGNYNHDNNLVLAE